LGYPPSGQAVGATRTEKTTTGLVGWLVRAFGNGFNGMPVFIIINDRFAILGCVSGCLVILIDCIADQGTKNGSCGQSDKGTLSIATNRLAY